MQVLSYKRLNAYSFLQQIMEAPYPMDIQEGQTKCHQDHKVFRPDLRDNRTHLWDTPLKVAALFIQ